MKVFDKKHLVAVMVLASLMLNVAETSRTYAASARVLQQETQEISGTVTDETGEGLPGASVIVKGTTNGVITNASGKYKLTVSRGATLAFIYLGYVTQEIQVGSRTVIDVVLTLDFTQLDEVVVTGYGTQRKSDITGSVSSVDTKTIQQIPVARADDALQGQVAGVRIQRSDASPNARIQIRVRGASSINGGNDPLVIVDGVQGMNLADIHPNDITSIEVLKDASATAIYGSRGASGVILVTTKKGKSGTPYITYNAYGSIAQIRKKLDLLNAAEYARVNNANRTARNLPAPFTAKEIKAFEQNGGTDWQDEIFRKGYSHNHHLTVSGGNENTSYSIAGDYVKTRGIVKGSSFEKFALRPNFSANFFSDKLRLSLNTFMSRAMDHPTVLNTRDREGSPIYAASLFSPTTPVYNKDGSYTQPNFGGKGVGPNTEFNPLALAVEPVRDNLQSQLVVSPTITYEIMDGLTVSSNISYQHTRNRDASYRNEKVVNGSEIDRKAFISHSLWSSFQNINIISYEKNIAEIHQLGITGVFEQQRQDNSAESMWNSNFLTNTTLYNNLGIGSDGNLKGGTNRGVYSNKWTRSLRSYMGRFNYSFAGRYLLTLTGRYDESSVFAANNKGGFFPSVAVGWNVTNESFLDDSPVFTNLKLRGSYGRVGNQAIGPYQSLSQLTSGSRANFSFDGGGFNSGVNLSTQLANPNLKWETTTQLNVGLDLEMFAGRVTLVADYYKKNTEDLLLNRVLRQASGYQTQLVNAGEVLNEGYEILLGAKPLVGAFEWSTQVTFSGNKNKVLSLNEGKSEFAVGGAGLPGFNNAIWIEKGQPIGLIRGYQFAGVWKKEESILAEAYGVIPGSPKYVDQNSDGVINDDDIVNIGSTLPEYTFGWNHFFNYRNFDLAVIIQGVYGNDIYNLGRYMRELNDNGTNKTLLNAWTAKNENTNIIGHNAQGVFRNDSRWIEDGSYIRIKNISLGYTLPSGVLQSLGGITSLRVYATATNLFTFTRYTGYDPESTSAATLAGNSQNMIDAFSGVDHSSFPSQKIYTLGLDIKF